MKAPTITPAFTGKIVIPSNGENKKVDYLYNKVSKLVKDNQVTANFRTEQIEILPSSNILDKIKTNLKSLGIKFQEPSNSEKGKLSKLA